MNALHTGYALHSGHERLLGATGPVAARQIEQLRERFMPAGHPHDLLAARNSLTLLLGMPQPGG